MVQLVKTFATLEEVIMPNYTYTDGRFGTRAYRLLEELLRGDPS
jgi:hypothetical protein